MGTHKGGMVAAAKNKRKFGRDFYVKIGREGGKKGHTGGFFGRPELASRAGKIGGAVSRRKPSLQVA